MLRCFGPCSCVIGLPSLSPTPRGIRFLGLGLYGLREACQRLCGKWWRRPVQGGSRGFASRGDPHWLFPLLRAGPDGSRVRHQCAGTWSTTQSDRAVVIRDAGRLLASSARHAPGSLAGPLTPSIPLSFPQRRPPRVTRAGTSSVDAECRWRSPCRERRVVARIPDLESLNATGVPSASNMIPLAGHLDTGESP